jgi:hypothetical protein
LDKTTNNLSLVDVGDVFEMRPSKLVEVDEAVAGSTNSRIFFISIFFNNFLFQSRIQRKTLEREAR